MRHLKKLFIAGAFWLAFFATAGAQVAPPYWNEITAFKKLDSAQAVAAHSILFIGSSSITKWKDINDYFPGYPIVNRGFGGSTLLDVIRYAYDIIIPYQPRQVVIYCGENDLAYSDATTAADVVKRVKTLFSIIRINLPETTIDYIAIKPSPGRVAIAGKAMEANKQIAGFLSKQKKAGFIDIYPAMVDKSGRPKGALFLQDSLHMKPEGYALWKKAIMPYLLK